MRSSLFSLLLSTASIASALHVEDIWSFPLSTWVENIAVRPNGKILASLVNVPELYQVDPEKKTNATLVASIPSKKAVFGIAELHPDIFYVNAGNFTHFPPNEGEKTFSVFKIDLRHWSPGQPPVTAEHIADLYDAGLLDGNTPSPYEEAVLFADATSGAVWKVDVETGAVTKVISDPLMAPNPKGMPLVGINGIKFFNNHLYWSNSNYNITAKIPVNASAFATGPAKVVAGNVSTPDDFWMLSGNHGIVAGDSEIQAFKLAEARVVTNTSLVEGSTAIRPGSCENSFYVATNGGPLQYATGQFTNPGKVVEIFL